VSVASRLSDLFRRASVVAAPGPTPAADRWDDQWRSRSHLDEWLSAQRERPSLYADSSPVVATLDRRCPDRARRTVAAADRILRHQFNLLGSGWFTPVDPARETRDGFVPIDWALDPIAGARFPTGFRHTDWKPDMRPGRADIKLPWELGRCQHWVTLGQAFLLSRDERYAAEIVREHADFLESNPVGVGVQYVCTMDVAIRAVNWAIAFDLIRTSASFDAAAMLRAYRSLFEVGAFVGQNLENTYEVTSNHFLSNVVGVCALGVVFRELPAGARWIEQGRAWLEQEMRVQVLPDGADFESSVPYHRLVTELFLAGARLAQLTGTPLSDLYLQSLRRMVEFLAAVTRPDGLLPQVGDADDGRLHVFTDYGDWNPQDGRHVLAPAACMLGAPEWLALAGDGGAWEAAWWGFDGDDCAAAVPKPQPGSARLFPDAGIAVSRSGDRYLLVTNGRVGTNGFGNHKHNDLLSFEFHANGQPLIVDAGSYVYTSDPESRNRFRSTSFHNTLCVDGVEQNDLKPEYLFRLFETSTVEHVRFDDTSEHTEYIGRHTAYTRLPSPVVHERTLRFVKHPGTLLIMDRLDGAGRHALAWHFHFAPGVAVEVEGPGGWALSTTRGRWYLRAPVDLDAAVSQSWYSPSYGVRVPCTALDLRVTADVAGAVHTFVIGR
jgi:hypothetical protein